VAGADPTTTRRCKVLAAELIEDGASIACMETGQRMQQLLPAAPEVFTSHIETCICPSGDCVKLAPAPCQMACPAGSMCRVM